jgi:hypothetical protein
VAIVDFIFGGGLESPLGIEKGKMKKDLREKIHRVLM